MIGEKENRTLSGLMLALLVFFLTSMAAPSSPWAEAQPAAPPPAPAPGAIAPSPVTPGPAPSVSTPSPGLTVPSAAVPSPAEAGAAPAAPAVAPAAPTAVPAAPEAAPAAPWEAPPSPLEQMFEAPYEVSVPHAVPRALKQFGYDLFRAPASTFAPVTDVPVGPDYVVGPGDTMIIYIWGLVENILTVTVDRNGNIFLPKAGTLRLAGLRFSEAEEQIRNALSKYFKKFDLKVAMKDLHTIKVFVVGEVVRPGGYTISSLSTISNALYVAGGPSKQGTMRNIRLLRNNKTVITLDLYDFLLRGDKSRDLRLETGDTVFVPPIGPVAAISGMVKRPAIYELTGPTRISELIEMAAGLIPTSYLKRVQIERVRGHQEKAILDLDLTALSRKQDQSADIEVQDGDLVKIFPIDTAIYNRVRLEGTVKYPGDYEWRPDLKLSTLLTPERLLPQSYLDRVEVYRLKPDFTTEVLAVNLRALLNGDLSQDLALQQMDRILVNTELRPTEAVTVTGEVRRPGTYPIVRGERLSSLIRRAGGFTADAYPKAAVFTRKAIRDAEKEELDRFIKSQQQTLIAESAAYAAAGMPGTEAEEQRIVTAQRQQLLSMLAQQVPLGRMAVHLDVPEKLENTPHDILLMDGDTLHVPKRPGSVLVLGSVRNPAAFLHKEGENYLYYLQRAGGLTPEADDKGIYILRADGSAETTFLKMRKIEVGDTIVVPLSTAAKYRPIPLARDIATIIGNFAVTLAVLIRIL